MQNLGSWFLANFISTMTLKVQSLRYSCVSVNGPSPIFLWSLILRILLFSFSVPNFLFSNFRPMYRRAASGEVDGIGGGRGQSLGTVKPTFAVLAVEAICEVCIFGTQGLGWRWQQA